MVLNTAIVLAFLACSDEIGPEAPPLRADTGDTEGAVQARGAVDGFTVDTGAPAVRGVLTVDPTPLVADGWSSVPFSLSLVDYAGEPLEDGVFIALEAELGTIESSGVVEDGVVTGLYVAGTWPGDEQFSVDGIELRAPELELSEPTPFSAQLHLHGSLSERGGTMRAHTRQAHDMGVDVLWWTDHAHYYQPESYPRVSGCDFESGALESTIASPSMQVDDWTLGWNQTFNNLAGAEVAVDADAAHDGEYGLGLSAPSKATGRLRLDLEIQPEFNIQPLMAEPVLRFWLRPHQDAQETGGLALRIPLSLTLADSYADAETHALVFFHGVVPTDVPEHEHWVQVVAPGDEWSFFEFDLTQLATEAFPELGPNQRAQMLTIELEKERGVPLAYDLDSLSWERKVTGAQDLVELQKAYLDSLEYAPVHFVGKELDTFGRRHVNAYGQVSFMDLGEGMNTEITPAHLVEHTTSQGGISSYNHMFGVRDLEEGEQTDALVLDTTEHLLDNELFGVQLLEVGYRDRVLPLEAHLRVWDELMLAGHRVTGVGVSDAHVAPARGDEVNNFVSWVAAGAAEEEQLIWGLRRGAVVFGDPEAFEGTQVRASLRAPEQRASMGQVIVGAVGGVALDIEITPLQAGWTVELVVDSAVLEAWEVEESGAFVASTAVDPEGAAFARVEVRDADGQRVLVTNPIHFADNDTGVEEYRLP